MYEPLKFKMLKIAFFFFFLFSLTRFLMLITSEFINFVTIVLTCTLAVVMLGNSHFMHVKSNQTGLQCVNQNNGVLE